MEKQTELDAKIVFKYAKECGPCRAMPELAPAVREDMPPLAMDVEVWCNFRA
jgi:thiol-disulfide isomerase/thioredoxin